jgi:hypothetical protein
VAPEQAERRLAAIMFTDIVGYTALMAESEETGLRVRERHRAAYFADGMTDALIAELARISSITSSRSRS